MKTLTLMQMAYLVAQESTCCSWKVGAVIEKNGMILGMGYNGTPHGQEHCRDIAQEEGWGKFIDGKFHFLEQESRRVHGKWSGNHEVHAEQNAIIIAAKNGVSVDGATMYVTLSPCVRCVNFIIQSGIRTLIYGEEYDCNQPDWAAPLIRAGIRVKKLDQAYLRMLNWENIQTSPKFVNS